MISNKLLMTVGGEETLYSSDVFSAYTYTGNGSTQTITNGIDLAGKGGMVWVKGRSGATSNRVTDTVRGANQSLDTDQTTANINYSGNPTVSAFSGGGFTVGGNGVVNTNASTYASWTFRKAAKFFDVVTYTGNGTAGRTIAHSLGVAPGMVIVKNTSAATNWAVWHRSGTQTTGAWTAYLDGTNGYGDSGSATWNDTSTPPTMSSSSFTVGSFNTTNRNADVYVAYLFAHDSSADGIVQCGSFTLDGANTASVTLGWEPQYVMVKRTNSTGSWITVDASRGFTTSGVGNGLVANTSAAETVGQQGIYPTATGFGANTGLSSAGDVYVYLAIRRPNKPPTTGTQVYQAIARTGTSAAATVTGVGFAPDLVASHQRTVGGASGFFDRLRGATKWVASQLTDAEVTRADTLTAFGMDGYTLGADATDVIINGVRGFINYCFKRAPGFFSEICYTGTGSNKTEVHDLGKAPDLMIVKSRSSANDWNVWCNGLSGTEKLVLNSTAAKVTDATAWNSTTPTSSVISLGTAAGTNTNAATYVAYLFSNLAGIQSIGTYVGDGTSGRLINCGFTTGSRFVCIKAISTTGNWLVADTVRGIVSGNDPYLALNSTAAEVTTEDWLDPSTSGFLVNQVTASNANVNGVTYMYWSIA